MSVSAVQPSPAKRSETPLAEWIDYPEQLILEGHHREGAEQLESVCRQAVRLGDAKALERIADIAGDSRQLGRRQQARFERIQTEALSDLALIEGGKPVPLLRERAGAGTLVAAIGLHLFMGFVALFVTFVVWVFLVGLGGWSGAGLEVWVIAGAALWVLALLLMVWRWVEFRECFDDLSGASQGFVLAAPFAFIPLLYFVLSPNGRRFVGLVPGPR